MNEISFLTGIDEAGRGALIGPLVIAGVTVNEKNGKKLEKIGVRDSKTLSPKRREELAGKIEKLASNVVVLRVQPCRIDDMRAIGINLDRIEAMKMAEIISVAGGDEIYVDSLQQNPKNFEKIIRNYVTPDGSKLFVRNYLDESIPVVSAASIIAKVNRDAAIRAIEEKVGQPIGVGYPHDHLTISFVENLLRQKKDIPTFVRKSWITMDLLKEKVFQKKLNFFTNKEKCKEEAV